MFINSYILNSTKLTYPINSRVKWEPRNNYPELVKAQFIDIPPRAKAGDEAEEV